MLEKIAYNINRNDEEPNIALAVQLCDTKDLDGIKEIAEGLESKNSRVVNDCIKVLYEIGERNPELISEYVLSFIKGLNSKNNRLIWGSMTALSKITSLKPAEVFENINTVIKAYEHGSVITRDNSISVFAELARSDKRYEAAMLKIILSHLKSCRPKEIAQHSERSFVCINKQNSQEFLSVLMHRRDDLSDAQKKRVDKLIKNIENI